MAQCVYCDKTTDLNTSLTVKLKDGTRVSVDICDEHEEDATIKTARQAYLDKQQKIADVMAQAKALGLDISDGNNGLSIATKSETPSAKSDSVPAKKNEQPEDMDGDDVVDTSFIDGKAGVVSVGGATDHGQVASHQSHAVTGTEDILPAEALEGKAKMSLIEGREGMPLAIPEKRVDGTGTTHIKVVKSNDQQLQERFKKMAGESIDDRAPDISRDGYQDTTVNCGFCRGSGRIKNLGKEIECPKCKGAGLLTT